MPTSFTFEEAAVLAGEWSQELRKLPEFRSGVLYTAVRVAPGAMPFGDRAEADWQCQVVCRIGDATAWLPVYVAPGDTMDAGATVQIAVEQAVAMTCSAIAKDYTDRLYKWHQEQRTKRQVKGD